MARWQVSRLRAETVEVTNPDTPDVRYVLQASKGMLRLEAWEKGELVEDALVARAVNEFIFESSDRSGARMRVAMSPTEDAITSHLVVNDDEVRVASPAIEHAVRIGAELKKRQLPQSPLSRALTEAMKQDDALLGEIRRYTNYGANVMRAEGLSNGVVAACVAACFLCALGSFAGCVACAICIELPSPGDPPPITVLSE